MTDTEGSSIEVTDTEGSFEKVGSYRYTSVKHLRLRPPASEFIDYSITDHQNKYCEHYTKICHLLVYFHHPT